MAQFCLVTQKLGVYVEDGPDEDHLPDRYQINGKVTFTPNITAGDSFKIVEGNDVVVMPAVSVTADIINGKITHNGQTGVYLFAAGENSNPTQITYTVAYTDLQAGETDGAMWAGKQQLSLRGLTFLAVPNGSVDLGAATPVAGTPGVGITQGDKGDPGDPFVYDDFTPEQLAGLKGEKGDTGFKGEKGDTGEKGEKGDTGEKGEPFVYDDFTPSQLAGLKGDKGDTGDPFTYEDFTPEQVGDLKGEKGDKGDPFIYDDFTPEQIEGLKGEVSLEVLNEGLGTKANKVDTQNSLGDMVGLLAGWTADMRGGRNLLLNSDVNVTSSDYLAASIDLVPDHGLKDGDRFVITLKGQLGSDRTQFIIFNSDASTNLGTIYAGTEAGVHTITRTWKASQGNDHIRVYAFPSTGTSESSIEWVKISRGTLNTPWTPAPEDAVADIKATGTTQVANPLAPIDHSLALRLDTSVGTRIFAGDTMIYGHVERIITQADLLNGWVLPESMSITLTRTGNLVTMDFPGLGLNASQKTGDTVLSIPYGFHPAGSTYYATLGFLSSQTLPVQALKAGSNLAVDSTAKSHVSGILTWRTADPFPIT